MNFRFPQVILHHVKSVMSDIASWCKSYQMGVHGLVSICLSIFAKKKDCEATVGVYPSMTQVFDLFALRLSLQLEKHPPKKSFLLPLLV